MTSCPHAFFPISSGCKLGVVGLSSRRCYHVVYGEFPCCLAGDLLDSSSTDDSEHSFYGLPHYDTVQSSG
jgi:hypothetical protein